jgi:hypothetical protein
VSAAYWKVNGARQSADFDSYATMSLAGLASGSPRIQYVGIRASDGAEVASPEVTVTINPGPISLTLSCPSYLYLDEGGGCSITANRPATEIHWYLGSVVPGSERTEAVNQSFLDLSFLGLGSYTVIVVAKDSAGNTDTKQRTVHVQQYSCLSTDNCIPR